jgi:uncharacterized protein YutE (UPF0331/DUF86 family)
MLNITREAEDYRRFVNEYFAVLQRSASMSPEDRAILQRTIAFLEEHKTQYAYYRALNRDDYTRDIHKRNDVERWVENIVNAGIDISKILLAAERIGIPSTYRETMEKAAIFLGLGEDFANAFGRWTRLGNILAHEYLDLKWNRIDGFVRESEPYLQTLLTESKRRLQVDDGRARPAS